MFNPDPPNKLGRLTPNNTIDSHSPPHHSKLPTRNPATAAANRCSSISSDKGGTKISDNTFSAILKSFTNIGRSSPEVTTNLLDAGLGDTVYGLLVGQTPPEIPDEHDLALELTSNSSVNTQALQAIGLVVEVLPPLPKSGIFDPRLAKKPINP
ncbi:Ubiquitin fusion degradation protein 4 [Puccinia graminis f. sp. tritici]|uniref:Ubiquitin fusion degradation protein 4 n=1 Tax=Puccinia graminis f. sp. tritici TaxID=56615 RepID=A0A5B0S549_PUCGR|nr:Ubiquitin fusion degradation protein 4 [Puccinia graminis f. sp. tritici]